MTDRLHSSLGGVKQKWEMQTRLDAALEAQSAIEANWREVCRRVNRREGLCCRVCGKRTDPHATSMLLKGHHHHLVYRSAGGADTVENVVLLDATCHDAVHVKRTLRIEGNAEEAVTIWRLSPEGEWYVARREIGPGRVERD